MNEESGATRRMDPSDLPGSGAGMGSDAGMSGSTGMDSDSSMGSSAGTSSSSASGSSAGTSSSSASGSTGTGAGNTQEFQLTGDSVIAKIQELVHEGNVRRIVVKHPDGHTIVEFPLTVGVVGVM